jgi:hypothetical protein
MKRNRVFGKGESPEHNNGDGDFTKVKVGRRPLLFLLFFAKFTGAYMKEDAAIAT